MLGISEVVKRKEDKELEEEEEKEVDPSLIGSLDNVYTEETEAEMMKEDDPFKRVPVVDKDKSTYEIEETVNALLVYSSESSSKDCQSPLPEDEDNDLSNASSQNPSFPSGPVDLLTSDTTSSDTVTDPPLIPGLGTSSQELLPDVIGGSSSGSQPTEVTSSNHIPPDVTPHGNLPPDLAAESQHPVDLLNSNNGGRQDPLDLTEGTSHGNTPDVTQQ